MTSLNSFEPDLAMVPRFSAIVSLLIPTPESKRVRVFSFSFVVSSILRLDPPEDWPYSSAYLCFSSASEQFERSSLTKTSLSVYILLATIFNNFLVSALNSIFCEDETSGPVCSKTISSFAF